MDIHKPKPWHGVREFLKEYLIIVVGVLTALGAEGAVQKFHEQRLSDEARRAVLAELNVNVTNVSRRLNYEPCIERRFDEIRDLLVDASASNSIPPTAAVGRPPTYLIYTQRWEASTASGRTALLPPEEQRAIAHVYSILHGVTEAQDDEGHLWPKLQILEGLKAVSPAIVYDQRLTLAEAVAADGRVVGGIQGARFFANSIGVKGDAHLNDPPSMRAAGTSSMCQPLRSGKEGR